MRLAEMFYPPSLSTVPVGSFPLKWNSKGNRNSKMTSTEDATSVTWVFFMAGPVECLQPSKGCKAIAC